MARESNGNGSKWLSIAAMVVALSISIGTLIYAAGIQGERVNAARTVNDKQDEAIAKLMQANSDHREGQGRFEGRVDTTLKSIEGKIDSIDERLSTLTDWLQQQQMERGSE